MAARVSDWYFMNGNTIEGVREQIQEVSALAREEGRKVKFGLNAFILVRNTEKEAHDVLREIIAQADKEAVEGNNNSLYKSLQRVTFYTYLVRHPMKTFLKSIINGQV